MSLPRRLLPILLCFAILQAQAQSDRGSAAKPDAPPQAGDIDTIRVVGATRSLRGLPGSVSVLDAEALRDGQRQVNLSESLQRVPGFTALDRQNYAQDLQIQSRGFGARSTFGIRGIRLIVDGIPSSAADGQGQAAAFPLSSLDRIEVLRGPLALQYGNAAGGVIVGLSELDAPPGPSFDAWVGSDRSRRVNLRVDGGANNDDRSSDAAWRWRATGSSFATDGARPHSAARRHQFNAIGEWTPRDDERLRVVYNGLRQPLAQDPLGLTRAAFARDPDSTDAAAASFDTRKTVREDQFGATWRREWTDALELRAAVYRTGRAVEQYLAVPAAAQSAPGSAGGVIDLRRASTGIDAAAQWRGAQGSIALGVEAARLDEDRRGFENFVGSRFGVRGRLRRDEDNRINVVDLYAAADYRFAERWTVLSGVRRSRLRFDSDDRYVANGDDSGGTHDANMALSFGVVRAFARGEIYASYGRGFETPTLNEMAYRPDGAAGFNRDLDASSNRAYELGLRWRSVGGSQRIEMALYRVEGENEIVPALNRGGRASFANAGATRREGVEFGASGDLGAHWRYAVAASWIDARFVEGFAFVAQNQTRIVAAGNRIPGVPRSDAFAELEWRSRDDRWSSALGVRMVGAIAVDDRNTDAAAGHVRIDWRGQWRARDSGWHAFWRIDNLFDRRYAGSVIVNEANGRYFEPAAGRGFSLGVGWRGR